MPKEASYIIFAYFALVSIVAICVTVSDKMRSKTKKYRTPEATLLAISALGGSVAMLFTMILIHHKTKHSKFMVGIPVIILLQLALAFTVMFFAKKYQLI